MANDPATNRFLHVRLFRTYTIPITREFIAELTATTIVNAVFLLDGARELKGALRRKGLEYRIEIHAPRNKVGSEIEVHTGQT